MRTIYLSVLAILLMNLHVSGQLKLDSTFAADGIKLDLLKNYDHWNQIIVEDDNKDYYVAGTDGISKINNDGTVATAFGNNGTALFPYDTAYSWYEVVDMKFQRDGKIVILAKSHYIFALMRYNTNGTIDNSFNGTGIITESLGVGMGNVPRGLAIDTKGGVDNIYVTGSHGPVANNGTCAVNFFVCKFKPDGSYDNSFHQNGQWISNSINTNATTTVHVQIMTGIHILSEDNIILTGVSPSPSAYVAFKINGVGLINSTFGTNGYWHYQRVSSNYYHTAFKSVAFGKDKLLLSFNSGYNSGHASGALLCLDTLGQSVNSFGLQGVARYGFAMYKHTGLAISNIPTLVDKDKNIYVALYSLKPNTNSYFKMVKLDSNGNLDNSFGVNSVLRLEPFLNDFCTGGSNQLHDFKVTSDNKFIFTYTREGTASVGNYHPGTGVYRYKDLNHIATNLSDIKTLDVSMSYYNQLISLHTKQAGTYNFVLYNMQGATIMNERFDAHGADQDIEIDLPSLPRGHYIGQVHKNGRTRSLKFTIQ